MTSRILLIVEGDTEEKSLPSVVARYLQLRGHYEIFPAKVVINTRGADKMKAPFRRGVNRGIEYWVKMAVTEFRPEALLIILDSDQECIDRSKQGRPRLGPELLTRARENAGGIPTRVAVANRKFEAWLVGAWPQLMMSWSTAPGDLSIKNPNAISEQDSKEAEYHRGHDVRLEKALGVRYTKSYHPERLTRYMPFDGDVLSNAPSYTRFLRTIDELVSEMKTRGGPPALR